MSSFYHFLIKRFNERLSPVCCILYFNNKSQYWETDEPEYWEECSVKLMFEEGEQIQTLIRKLSPHFHFDITKDTITICKKKRERKERMTAN